MKKIVLNSLLLLFTFNFLCSQTYIKNDAYEVMYSQAFQQPITVAYKYPDFKVYTVVGLEKINGITNKVSYPDPVKIKTSINWKVPENIVTSDKDDYSSPYDRGHLAPAASFTKDEQQKFIHSYLNCAIMHKALNRGVWKTLENRERKLSENYVFLRETRNTLIFAVFVSIQTYEYKLQSSTAESCVSCISGLCDREVGCRPLRRRRCVPAALGGPCSGP